MQRALGKMVVGNLLTTAAARYAEREAVFCSETGRRLTYRVLNERVNRLAHALMGMNLKKGDTVAMLSTNRVEVIEIYFALAKTGIVGMPLNYRLAPREMFEVMNSVGARGLLCEAAFDDVLRRVADEVPTLQHRVVIGGHASLLDYEALLAAARSDEPEVEVEEADPFYFNLTSGTSGLPKCYTLTHYNNAAVIPGFLALDRSSQDVALTVFPLYGRVGFAWSAAAIVYGIRHVIANFDAGRMLQLIEQERVTITNLVPTMGAMLLAQPDLAQRDLSSLRALVFAGSMLPEPIRQGATERLCPRLYEYYGMQECGTLVVSTPQDRERRPASVGRVVLFAEVRIVDEQGRSLATGEIGEIVCRSPTATTAYHRNPEKSAEAFRDGWLHTGDLGSFDDEGYLFIRGRKKDMIVSGGQNVFAAEVEEAILALPEIADCAVIGLPDPLWGERVSAVVVLRAGAVLTPEALLRHCRERLAGFKTPKQVLMQQEPLPRTATGKVQKFVLVERYGEPATETTAR